MNPSLSRAAIETAQWATLRFTSGTRYYRLHLEQDLWGTWFITRVNGRTSAPLGCAGTREEGLTASPRRLSTDFAADTTFLPIPTDFPHQRNAHGLAIRSPPDAQIEASERLHRPIDVLSIADVERVAATQLPLPSAAAFTRRFPDQVADGIRPRF